MQYFYINLKDELYEQDFAICLLCMHDLFYLYCIFCKRVERDPNPSLAIYGGLNLENVKKVCTQSAIQLVNFNESTYTRCPLGKQTVKPQI